MTNLRKDRVPGRTLSQPSAPEVQAVVPDTNAGNQRTFVLAVRLFASDANGASVGVSFNNAGPPTTLALDLIKASGGTRDAGGDAVVTAGFPNLQSALLTARRLQWALEGLGGEGGNATATILVHSVQDPSAASALAALEKASPGRILLGSSVAESVYQLPNIMLRDASGPGGWREMLWRSAAAANPAADEQSMLRQIREMGREDPCPAEPEPPAPRAVTATVRPAVSAPMPEDDLLGPVRREPPPAPATKKWLIVGGAAAAAVVFGAVLIPFLAGKHAKTSVPLPAPATTVVDTPPTVPAPVIAAPAPVVKTPPTKPPRALVPKPPRADQPGESATLPKGSSKCDLTESEIPKTLDRADHDLHAGQLEEAQAQYERLVGCPGAREKAQAGLKLVKQRLITQGSGP
ncbi:MAG TPA: hypothetical protein VGG62_17850 [Terracidiphilus sp.]